MGVLTLPENANISHYILYVKTSSNVLYWLIVSFDKQLVFAVNQSHKLVSFAIGKVINRILMMQKNLALISIVVKIADFVKTGC